MRLKMTEVREVKGTAVAASQKQLAVSETKLFAAGYRINRSESCLWPVLEF
jgi:hypothetical protein